MHDVHGIAALPDSEAPGWPVRAGERGGAGVLRGVRAHARPAGGPAGAGRRGRRGRGRPAGRAGGRPDLDDPHAGQRDRDLVAAVRAALPGRRDVPWTSSCTPTTTRARSTFRGRRVVVVGGGASAVQLLGEIAPVAAATLWVTRREPVWRTDDFTPEVGRAAVALVEERVRRGLPPASVVSVTGLALREQEREAERLGAYERHPMFEAIEPDGVRMPDGTLRPADVILWATGFRPRGRSPGAAAAALGVRRHPARRHHRGRRSARAARRLRPLGQHHRRQPGRPGGRPRRGRVARRSRAEDGLQRLTIRQVGRLDGRCPCVRSGRRPAPARGVRRAARPRRAGRARAGAGRRPRAGWSSSRRAGSRPSPARRRPRRSGRGRPGRRGPARTAPRRRAGPGRRTDPSRTPRSPRRGRRRRRCRCRRGRAGRRGRAAAAGRSGPRPRRGSRVPNRAARRRRPRHRPGQVAGELLRLGLQPQQRGRRQARRERHLDLGAALGPCLGQQPLDLGVPLGDPGGLDHVEVDVLGRPGRRRGPARPPRAGAAPPRRGRSAARAATGPRRRSGLGSPLAGLSSHGGSGSPHSASSSRTTDW